VTREKKEMLEHETLLDLSFKEKIHDNSEETWEAPDAAGRARKEVRMEKEAGASPFAEKWIRRGLQVNNDRL